MPFDSERKNKRRLNVLDRNNNILWVVVIHIYNYKYTVRDFFLRRTLAHDIKLLKVSHIV